MSLISNERTKLTATYVNGMAIAIAAIGAFAPLASFVAGSAAPPSTLLSMALGCLLASAILHLVARKFLGRLQP